MVGKTGDLPRHGGKTALTPGEESPGSEYEKHLSKAGGFLQPVTFPLVLLIVFFLLFIPPNINLGMEDHFKSHFIVWNIFLVS